MQISISNIVKGTVIGSAFTAISRYFTRVTQAGAIYEKPLCVESGINSSPLLQQASMLILPSGYKGGTAYAELPSNGNGDLTWTRASDAWRTNSDGLIQRVPWNLASYSEEFSNAYWIKPSATITANSTTAPNGTLTADNISFASSGYVGVTRTDNGSMTFSVYAKYNGTQWLCVENFNSNDKAGWFDLLNGVVGATINGATSSIENVGNGWYRCIVTMTTSSVTSSIYAFFTVSANSGFTRSGNANFWGAQLVEGTTAQTYLPTTDRLNFPRLSYMYGSCPALLLEPQRTNLFVRSNEFSNVGVWVTTNLTVSDNSQIGIDGNTTAALITTTSTLNLLNQQVAVTAGTVYTFSFYVKRGTMTDLKYRVRNVTGASDIIPPTSYYSQTNSATFTRISVTVTAPVGCTAITFYPFSDTGSIGTAIITQAQVEVGSYATTIIPTTSAQATRIADFATTSTSLQSAGILGSVGNTAFYNVTIPQNTNRSGQFCATLTSGSVATNSLGLVLNTASIQVRSWFGGTGQLNYTLATNPTTLKIALSYVKSTKTIKIFVNGSLATTVSSIDFADYTQLTLHDLNSNTQTTSLFYHQIALFNSALSDSDCIALTT